MKPSVYLETTIVSYLTARPSKNSVLMGMIESTKEWWEQRRVDFDLFISDTVYTEASGGDPDAAQLRLEAISDISRLTVSKDARELAKELLTGIPLPMRAETDALHLAIAAVNGVDFLLTWNCRHLANAALRHRIEYLCHEAGFQPPMICTPWELMEP